MPLQVTVTSLKWLSKAIRFLNTSHTFFWTALFFSQEVAYKVVARDFSSEMTL